MITIGSCFAGIGGLELGLERSIPGARVIWQCEQDKFCQQVLKKHWPEARLYNDIRTMSTQDVERPTILCGGFPCQDLSLAGKGEGIHGKKSGLWWHMLALIGRLLPRIIVLENVSAITFRGGRDVVGSLAELGYSCEWGVIRSGSTFGAPHRRARWFCVAYSYHRSEAAEIQARRQKHLMCNPGRRQDASYANDNPIQQPRENGKSYPVGKRGKASIYKTNCKWEKSGRGKNIWNKGCFGSHDDASHTNSERCHKQSEHTQSMEQTRQPTSRDSENERRNKTNYWQRCQAPPAICRVDDGIPNRLDRLKSLGNAVVPQCAEWIGTQIWRSGLLES